MIASAELQSGTLDPRTKLAIALAALIGSLGSSTWMGLTVTLFAVLVWSLATRLPVRSLGKSLRAIRVLFLFTLLFHSLFGTGEAWLSLGPITLTKAGLIKGLWMSSRLALMVIAATVLTSSTSPLHLTQGLDAALTPLQRIGIPTREFTMIFGISLRFLPILADEARRIQDAQTLRGLDPGTNSVAARIRALLPVLVPLLGGALRRADELGDAMAARGYHPRAERTYLHPLHFGRVDGVITVGSLVAGVAVAVWL